MPHPDPQTHQQAESIIAFAEFAGTAGPSNGTLDRVLALLEGVPTWEVEASLGVQGARARGGGPASQELTRPRLAHSSPGMGTA